MPGQKVQNMDYREKMTANLKQAMGVANDVSVQNGVTYIGSEHLIYAFLSMPACVAYRVLTEKISFTKYSEAFIRNLDKNTRAQGLTPRTKEMFLRAVQLASKSGEKAGTAHFLLAVLEQENCFAVKILRLLGVDTAEMKRRVTEVLRERLVPSDEGGTNLSRGERKRYDSSDEGETNLSRGERSGLSSGEEGSDASGENKGYAAGNGYTKGDSGADYRFGGTAFNGRDEGTDAFGDVGNDSVVTKKGGAAKASGESLFADEKLMRFGVDLTERARKGKLDPVIGREKEIEKLVQVLCRRSKNNPVLIGEPGVGKSAIAEGLAQLIAAGNVPEQLFNKKVFSVDLAGMLAGAKYRGEFEERLKDLMQAVTDDGDILLFIDEIHTLVGAGASSENTMDAANILKPLLARGEMQIVGATTIEEYRKYIEKDGALERRFTPIMVEEPSKDAAIGILKGLRPRYEKHHGLRISDEAIEAAVTLSMRYVTDRYLPDKAIDLIDEAASRARIVKGGGEETAEIEKKAEEKEQERRLYMARGDFARATTALKEKRELEERAENERRVSEMKIGADGRYVLGKEQIAAIISAKTKIPLTKITQAEGEKLMRLEEDLHKRIVGQNEAVSAVARAIRRARAGLKDPSRPIGSFIFVGPTGVGKTDLCKALAETLFGSEEQMIRLDMSEYMEKSSVSKLIGAAPGYVGYDDLKAGQLTEKVRTKPYCVVLFDEIEKAHPDVFNLLLQLLDDGRLTDNKGRTVSFKNAVVILTSNVGAAEKPDTVRAGTLGFGRENGYPGGGNQSAYGGYGSENNGGMGGTNAQNGTEESAAERRAYAEMKDRITAALKERFRPEFLNRLDDVIVFHRLSLADVERIGGKLLDSLAARLLEQRGIVLCVTDEAKRQLAEEGYEPELGARELKRVVQRKIEDRLSEEILLGKISAGSRVTVDCRGGQFVFLS